MERDEIFSVVFILSHYPLPFRRRRHLLFLLRGSPHIATAGWGRLPILIETMYTNTTVMQPSSRRCPHRGSWHPAREPILVSLCLKCPPQPSTLFVHSSDLNHNVLPDIVCSLVLDICRICVQFGYDWSWVVILVG
jgi:hypothetical protein